MIDDPDTEETARSEEQAKKLEDGGKIAGMGIAQGASVLYSVAQLISQQDKGKQGIDTGKDFISGPKEKIIKQIEEHGYGQ